MSDSAERAGIAPTATPRRCAGGMGRLWNSIAVVWAVVNVGRRAIRSTVPKAGNRGWMSLWCLLWAIGWPPKLAVATIPLRHDVRMVRR
jgi:hypothetical protein